MSVFLRSVARHSWPAQEGCYSTLLHGLQPPFPKTVQIPKRSVARHLWHGGSPHPAVARRLRLELPAMRTARSELEAAGLVAYEAPLWQVLELPGGAA